MTMAGEKFVGGDPDPAKAETDDTIIAIEKMNVRILSSRFSLARDLHAASILPQILQRIPAILAVSRRFHVKLNGQHSAVSRIGTLDADAVMRCHSVRRACSSARDLLATA
jgi:hypothetical protein